MQLCVYTHSASLFAPPLSVLSSSYLWLTGVSGPSCNPPVYGYACASWGHRLLGWWTCLPPCSMPPRHKAVVSCGSRPVALKAHHSWQTVACMSLHQHLCEGERKDTWICETMAWLITSVHGWIYLSAWLRRVSGCRAARLFVAVLWRGFWGDVSVFVWWGGAVNPKALPSEVSALNQHYSTGTAWMCYVENLWWCSRTESPLYVKSVCPKSWDLLLCIYIIKVL